MVMQEMYEYHAGFAHGFIIGLTIMLVSTIIAPTIYRKIFT